MASAETFELLTEQVNAAVDRQQRHHRRTSWIFGAFIVLVAALGLAAVLSGEAPQPNGGVDPARIDEAAGRAARAEVEPLRSKLATLDDRIVQTQPQLDRVLIGFDNQERAIEAIASRSESGVAAVSAELERTTTQITKRLAATERNALTRADLAQASQAQTQRIETLQQSIERQGAELAGLGKVQQDLARGQERLHNDFGGALQALERMPRVEQSQERLAGAVAENARAIRDLAQRLEAGTPSRGVVAPAELDKLAAMSNELGNRIDVLQERIGMLSERLVALENKVDALHRPRVVQPRTVR